MENKANVEILCKLCYNLQRIITEKEKIMKNCEQQAQNFIKIQEELKANKIVGEIYETNN